MDKAVVIGGGTGLSVLLAGLKDRFHVTAIVTVGDNGGGSGILRRDFDMLPPGDIRNCLYALSQAPKAMRELLGYRFSSGSLSGQSMGNLMIAAMSQIHGSFERGVLELSKILNIKGRVLPVSPAPMTLVADLSDGSVVRGESEIALQAFKAHASIEKLYLLESVPLLEEAAQALREADVVILGPGSLFTSVIANLLVDPLPELAREKKVIYVCNVMTQPEETAGYSAEDHLRQIARYLGKAPEVMLVSDGILPCDVLERYAKEGAVPVCLCGEPVAETEVICGPYVEVLSGYVRSNATCLAREIEGILHG